MGKRYSIGMLDKHKHAGTCKCMIVLTSKCNLECNTLLNLKTKTDTIPILYLFNPYIITKAIVSVWLITMWVHA